VERWHALGYILSTVAHALALINKHTLTLPDLVAVAAPGTCSKITFYEMPPVIRFLRIEIFEDVQSRMRADGCSNPGRCQIGPRDHLLVFGGELLPSGFCGSSSGGVAD
jgi:hypothetical protein